MLIIPIFIYILAILIVAWQTGKHKHKAGKFMEEYFIGSRSMGGLVLAMTLISSYVGASSFIGGPGVAGKHKHKAGKFMEEYFIGSRSMGGLVLAMTLISSYVGASSFIGGPGVAYNLGLSWVFLACIQVPTAFFTLGILGKKLAIISRKINGVTITDYLRARYESNLVIVLASLMMLIFFITLGILGKKLAIISRKINGVTITDYLRARYESNLVIVLASLMMLIFFIGTIVAQFVGGARLFESVTGLSYNFGLILFTAVVIIYTTFGGFRAVTITDAIQGIVMLLATGLLFFIILEKGNGMEFTAVVIIYTTFGGFRAVTITDAIQGIVMLLATGLLFFIILEKGNGMENIMQTLLKTNPNLLTPDSNGAVSKPFILSFWMLVGAGVLGLPVTEVRCMGFKDSKAMHRAMIIGTSIVGILMLGMHLVGVMGAAVEPGVEVGDKIIPILAIKNMHPFLAGVFIAGPLVAIMSSVDSLLIMSSAAIVKDLYINYIDKNPSESKIKKLSFATSLLLGIIVFILALNPPKLSVWINLFALAGQEAAFFCPILLGLYWKRANALAIKNMHPILAGVFIAGPLAAIMSSVDSLLIMSSAAIVKDLYINYIDKNPSESKIKKLSFATSLLLGIIVFVLALNPPKLLVWINLFALAGQEAAFFCPILLGLYWKRANATGAAVSMIFSVVFYLYTVIMNIKIMNMHQIVPTIIFSILLLLFTIGSYFGKPNSEKVNELFFSEK